jgi:hypothetical protein
VNSGLKTRIHGEIRLASRGSPQCCSVNDIWFDFPRHYM